MQVSVTYLDLGLPTVSFTADADSLVSDVLTAAAEEWDIDPEEVELSFAGELLCETGRLAAHGVGPNAELEVVRKRFRLYGFSWLIDEAKREELLRRLAVGEEECLHLDTPTFSKRGCVSLVGELVPPIVESISFCNSNTEITVIARNFLRDCSSLAVLDLASLSSLTTIEGAFLVGCSSLTSLNLSDDCRLTSIGGAFLASCSSITSLNLSGLGSVIDIGPLFLAFCFSITTLDLSNLSAVVNISSQFLEGCDGLRSIQLPDKNKSLFLEKSEVVRNLIR